MRPFRFSHLLTAILVLTSSTTFAQQSPSQQKKETGKHGAPANPQKQVSPETQPTPAIANTEQMGEQNKAQALATIPPAIDPKTFNGMQWRLVGPFRGGRVLAVEGIPGDPTTYYFGGASGGVWKSSDGGVNWKPLFDKETVASIGSIAVAPSDHNVIYVGSGEACIRGNISYGDGVYKTVDGGRTWNNVGLKDSRHIGAVVVNPKDANNAFVAALGHAYGPNAERGIFRTRDGGKTWEKVLYVNDQTGGIDVVFDPNNPNILFAAMWQVLRTPWSLDSGGPGSGLYRSNDGGSTWKRLEGNGLPKGIMGRIGVSVSGADSNRVYALIENKEGGLFSSSDGGDTWKKANDDERYRQRAWYFTHIFADPKSVDTVYVLNTGAFKSTDGGKTFDLMPAPHGDHHGLWIDPKNPQRMINGNDGGATITTDGGKTWTAQDNQPTAQFYHIIDDNRWPWWIYGAQQDNSTVGIATYDDEGAITRADWYDVGGGESGYIAPDPRDPEVIYAGSAAGYITRANKRTMQYHDVSIWPVDVSGHGAGEYEHRFQWTEPIIISKHDPNVIYSAGEVVWKSTDQGNSWTAISKDLTRNDKAKQVASGGPITKDNTGVEVYDTVFTLAESPKDANTLWAGTDDGLIQLTRDGGKSWTNITPKDLPEWSMVSLISLSPKNEGTAYAAIDRHRLDDIKPYIFKTTDFGKTWTRIENGIPVGSYVHAVIEDPVREGLLFAGTETGPYVSFDSGAHWQPIGLNLPTVPVHDLLIHDTDLAAATHGRAFWVLDDITPLRQAAANIANAQAHLYAPRNAMRLYIPLGINRGPVGQNPPGGALFNYYLAQKPEGEITIDITDANGKLVHHFSNREKANKNEQPPEWPDQERPVDILPAKPGMNRFAWNLRWTDPVEVPGAFYAGNGPQGMLSLPGKYTATLTADGKKYTQPFEIYVDPRVAKQPNIAENMQKEFDLASKTRDRITELHTAILQIRGLKSQLKSLEDRLGNDPAHKPVIDAAQAFTKKLDPIEGQLIQTQMKSSEGNLNYPTMLNEMFDTFSYSIESSDDGPTKQQLETYDWLTDWLNKELTAWKQVQQTDLPALNNLIQQHNVPVIGVGEVKTGD
jgi:photosystem II stability/assembly factor-like uncharacterized protein